MEKEVSFVGEVKLRTFWGRWKDSRWEMKPNLIEIYINNKLKYHFDLLFYQVAATDASLDKSIKITFTKRRETINLFIAPPSDKHSYWINAILENAKRVSEIKIEDFNDAVVLTDNKGNIQKINKLAEQLFGYSQEEIVGQNVKVLMPGSMAKYHDNHIQAFQKTSKRTLLGKPRVLPIVNKSGETLNVIINLGITVEYNEIKFIGIFMRTDDVDAISPIYRRFLPSSKDEGDTSSDWSDDGVSHSISTSNFRSLKSVYHNLLSMVEFTPYRSNVRESFIPAPTLNIEEDEEENNNTGQRTRVNMLSRANRSQSSPSFRASNSISEFEYESTDYSDIDFSDYTEDKINDQISVNRYSFIHKTDIYFKKDTALHLACETRQWEIGIKLLEYGADPNSIRSFKLGNANIKQTPFEIILEYYNLDEISTNVEFARCVEKFLSVGTEGKIGRLFIKKKNYKLYTYACILSNIAAQKNYLILPNLKISSINFMNRYYHQFAEFLLELDLSSNKLEELSSDISKLVNLTSLNISQNLLKYLPKSLATLENLLALNVKGNPLDMPKSVIKGGCKSILQYIATNEQNHLIFDDSLNEIKLMIMGEKKAGKSSILNIISDSFKSVNKDQTEIMKEISLAKTTQFKPKLSSQFHTVSFLDIIVGSAFQIKSKSFVMRGKFSSNKRNDYFEDIYTQSRDSSSSLSFIELDRKTSVNVDHSPKEKPTSTPVGFLSLLSSDERESVLQFDKLQVKSVKQEEIKNVLLESLSDKDNGILEFENKKAKKFLHKNQFSGSDFVDWILSVTAKYKLDRQKATFFAQWLIDENLVKGTGKEETKFKDSLKTFYFINDDDISVIVNAFDFSSLNVKCPNFRLHVSDNTIYIIVFDITKQKKEEQKKLDRWLEEITENSKHCSVIIVATHIDELPDHTTISDITNILLEFDEVLAIKYPQIKGITAVSCKSGYGQSHIRTMLKNEVFQSVDKFRAPYRSSKLLSLILLESIDFPLLSWNDIISRTNYYEMTPSQIHYSLSYLHNIGSLFYHSKNLVVTNFKQLNYLYLLIYSSPLASNAVITANGIKEIWKLQDERLLQFFDHIISAFCSYRLLIKMNEEIFIIPSLLSIKYSDRKMNLAANSFYSTSSKRIDSNTNNNSDDNVCIYFNDRKYAIDKNMKQRLIINTFDFDKQLETNGYNNNNNNESNNETEEFDSDSDNEESSKEIFTPKKLNTSNSGSNTKIRSWGTASLTSARKNKKILVRIYLVNILPSTIHTKILNRILEIFSNTSRLLYYIWESGIIVYTEKYRISIELNSELKLILFELWIIEKRFKKEAYYVLHIIMDSIRTLLTHWYTNISQINTYIPCSTCMQYLPRKVELITIDPTFPNSHLGIFEPSHAYSSMFEDDDEADQIEDNFKDFNFKSNTLHSSLSGDNKRSKGDVFKKSNTLKFRKSGIQVPKSRCDFCLTLKKNSLDFEISFLTLSAPLNNEALEKAPTLGEGAFGVVKKLTIVDPKNKNQSKDIAVKVFFSDLESVSYSEILREIWIMQMIKNHPNIVNIIGVSKKPLSIQMELIPKKDLYSYLHNKENPEMSWHLRLKIVKEIASAMHYLHSFTPPLVHRDLKSPNILMISDDPNDEINVKLSDFGLTQFIFSDGIKQLTENRDVQTPTWLSPEVIIGHPHNEKADCYALGIIMWELLSRELPFSEFQNRNHLQFITEEIIKSAKRPRIPNRFVYEFAPHHVQEYVNLMVLLWDQIPSNRPSFEVVLQRIAPLLDVVTNLN